MENNFFTIVIILCGVIIIGSIALILLRKKEKKSEVSNEEPPIPDIGMPEEPLDKEDIPEIEEPTIDIVDEVGYTNGDMPLEQPDPLKTQMVQAPEDLLKTQRIDNPDLLETQLQESPEEESPKTRLMNASPPEPVAEIDILVNDQLVKTHKLFEGELNIGRDPGQAQIVIPELIVSKHHCTLSVQEGNVKIIDTGSTNGVYIDGERVYDVEMTGETTVFLGKKGTVKIICRKL
jgi:hypothetical protein